MIVFHATQFHWGLFTGYSYRVFTGGYLRNTLTEYIWENGLNGLTLTGYFKMDVNV